ncbi:helix-turn-helix transcriptional regulator [Azospirillum sp. B4]|uniref:helix-turn-helix domain-containing protein n=1 Tax=Azospirillum sp. B4 TaxID=95605 RepID=UPI00131ED2E1|nr:helix-turn-helix transcriptional regulator [Azospirillum sp. B4]
MPRAEAAVRLNTHPVTLGTYERGAALPTAEVLIAMREVYAISLDWLISGVGEMRGPALPPDQNRLPDRGRLRALFQAFIDTVARQPATLQKKPEELADWLLRGYDWMGGPSPDDGSPHPVNTTKEAD